jgi:hypothetical protein
VGFIPRNWFPAAFLRRGATIDGNDFPVVHGSFFKLAAR